MFQQNCIQPFLKLYYHFFLKLFGEKILVKSVKLLALNIKLIYPIQKYPHITESYACFLKIFAIMFLLLIKFLLEYVQPQSYQNMSQFWYLHIMLSNEFQYQNAHQDLLHMPHLLFCQANYLWNKHH